MSEFPVTNQQLLAIIGEYEVLKRAQQERIAILEEQIVKLNEDNRAKSEALVEAQNGHQEGAEEAVAAEAKPKRTKKAA